MFIPKRRIQVVLVIFSILMIPFGELLWAQAEEEVRESEEVKVLIDGGEEASISDGLPTQVAKEARAPAQTSEVQALSPNQKRANEKGSAAENLQLLNEVNLRYSKAKSLKLDIKKRVIQTALGRDTPYEGQLWALRDRLRIEFTVPTPSFMVADGKFVWMVSATPKELGGGVQVAKTKMSSNKKSQGWMSLLGRKKITDSFKVISSQQVGDLTSFKLKPITGFEDLDEAEMVIHAKNREIVRLSYSDELENEIIMDFSSVSFGGKVDKSLFVYKPPKGVEVVTY